MKICGPKCSLCGLIISAWGIIQLVLMGIFYHVRSVALAEDLPIEESEVKDVDEFYAAVERGYTQNAINCWIAACLYILTFILSGHQFYVNSRSSLTILLKDFLILMKQALDTKDKSHNTSVVDLNEDVTIIFDM